MGGLIRRPAVGGHALRLSCHALPRLALPRPPCQVGSECALEVLSAMILALPGGAREPEGRADRVSPLGAALVAHPNGTV
eukprot:4672280-Pyramimonas_sp.AAC.1